MREKQREAVSVNIGERGQVTIPKKLRERFGLHKNVEVEFIEEDRSIRIVKAKSPFDKLRGIITLEPGQTVDDYIEEIRGR